MKRYPSIFQELLANSAKKWFMALTNKESSDMRIYHLTFIVFIHVKKYQLTCMLELYSFVN